VITQGRSWPIIAEAITAHGDGEATVTLTAHDDSGTEIGFLKYERYTFGVSVFYVIVEPVYRRRGVASMLMDKVYADNPDAVISRGVVFEDGQRFLAGYDRTRGISDDLAVPVPDPVMAAAVRVLISQRGASGRLV
jgi:GNAT superfamily N-acetyltransferase